MYSIRQDQMQLRCFFLIIEALLPLFIYKWEAIVIAFEVPSHNIPLLVERYHARGQSLLLDSQGNISKPIKVCQKIVYG